MTVASALLQRHIETLLSPGEWETLIADDILGNFHLRQRSDIPVASKDARRLRRTSSGSGVRLKTSGSRTFGSIRSPTPMARWGRSEPKGA